MVCIVGTVQRLQSRGICWATANERNTKTRVERHYLSHDVSDETFIKLLIDTF